MFFIFGWNHEKKTNFGPVEEHTCEHCNNTKMWNLSETERYFTLFFIPIFPHDRDRWLLCPICTYGIKLEKEDFESYKTIADLNTALAENKITEEERNTQIAEVHKKMDQRYEEERLKSEAESKKWEATVSEKTDEELTNMITKKRGEYSLAFIIAAEKEIEKRKRNDTNL